MAHGRIREGNAVQDRFATRKGVLQKLQFVVMRGGGWQLLRRMVFPEEGGEEGGGEGWEG